MAEETKPLNLRAKLIKVMADVGNVPKGGQNQQGAGYKYQRIADIMPKVQAACVEHGVVFVAHHISTEWHPSHESKGGTQVFVCSVRMKYIFSDTESEETMTAESGGHAFDTSDKTENKAKTAALKYFLKQTFLIGEEEDDSERESVETRYRKPAQQGATRGRVVVKPDGQGVQGSTQRAPREPKPDSPNKADKVDVMRFWTEVTAALGVEEGRKWMTARMVENDIDPADPKRLDKILQFMLINWRKALAEFQGAPPTDESSGPDIEFETEEEKAHEPL
jgi:hypothetical protein